MHEQSRQTRWAHRCACLGIMPANFNGVRLRKVTSLKTTVERSGFKRTSFRVMESPLTELEQILYLGAPALLILSSAEIEGHIVQYRAEMNFGYEITIDEVH